MTHIFQNAGTGRRGVLCKQHFLAQAEHAEHSKYGVVCVSSGFWLTIEKTQLPMASQKQVSIIVFELILEK